MVRTEESAEVSVLVSQCSMQWYKIMHRSFEHHRKTYAQLHGGLDEQWRFTAGKAKCRSNLLAQSQRLAGGLDESLERSLRKSMKPHVVLLPPDKIPISSKLRNDQGKVLSVRLSAPFQVAVLLNLEANCFVGVLLLDVLAG